MRAAAPLLLLLAGCSTTHVVTPLPAPPAHLVQCAEEAAIDVPEGPLSRRDTAAFVARLRASELAKRDCAVGWAAWYGDLSDR